MKKSHIISRLHSMMAGHIITAALRVVAELNIADYLRDRAQTAEELAETIGCHDRTLGRVMAALSEVGIFERNEDHFSLTEISNLLRTDVQDSERDLVLEFCNYFEYLGRLTETVMKGEPAMKHPYEEILSDSKWRNNYLDCMDKYYYPKPGPLSDNYDFADVRSVIDIGGGSGAQVIGLLKQYPHLKAVLFDLPEVCEYASKKVMEKGLAERCEIVSGDFFCFSDLLGLARADVYMLINILQNFNEEETIDILLNVSKLMTDNSKLLIVAITMPNANSSSEDERSFISEYWWDLFFLVICDGAVRTHKQHFALFNSSNLECINIITADKGATVFECKKKSATISKKQTIL